MSLLALGSAKLAGLASVLQILVARWLEMVRPGLSSSALLTVRLCRASGDLISAV